MRNGSMAYCLTCNEDIQGRYTIKSKKEEITKNDITVNAVILSAYCNKCGQEVYVPDVNDVNVEMITRAFKYERRKRDGK